MEKVCQSCGLPLNERILGNENNGTFSQEYCYLCYRNGKFILPNLTMDEMKQQISKIVNQSLENKKKMNCQLIYCVNFIFFLDTTLQKWKKLVYNVL